jgi:hypothetical protein
MNDVIIIIPKAHCTTRNSSIWHCQICFTFFQFADRGYHLTPAMATGKCFADLPNELLLEIFSSLDIEDLAMSVQHVNSHWKDVSQDESLWKNQTFSPGYKMSDDAIAEHLMNMPTLRAFAPTRGTNTKVINTMCKYCRDIRHIEFKWSHKLRNSTLQNILDKQPHLESLNIPLPRELDQLDFARMLGQFQKVTTLSFTDKYVHAVADGVLKAIAEGCPSLVHIDLGNSTFQDQDVKYLLERKGRQLLSFSVRCYISTVAHRLLTECSNLEHLLYDNYNEDLPSTYIQFLSKLSKLRNLSLSYFKEGQTRNISHIFKKQSLSKLIELDICYCDGFDATALTGILTNCHELKSLVFRGHDISDDGFQHIGTCKSLEHLDISFNSSLTDKSMEYVGAGCPNLKHLNIGSCSGLTNKSTEYVCTGCQKLKYLDIQQSPKMTDDVLENIFRSKELEVLNVMWNLHLLGINFHMIPTHLVHLTELNVEGCPSIDEKCLDKLQEEMPHLKIIRSHMDNEEPDVDIGEATFFISQLL